VPSTPLADGGLTRARSLAALAAITIAGGLLRFYNLGWGAPYYHFHIDEHFVFAGADLLRRSTRDAALSPKFFMYSPLPMYLLNLVRAAYEAVRHPLDLTVPQDEITYMVMGRAIAAAFGTASIPLVYVLAARLSGRIAGLVAAACLAVSVLHLRESHFFSVDVTMVFFALVTWIAITRIVDRGDARASVMTGVAFAAALLCKYSAAFMAVPIGVAYLVSPARPRALGQVRPWLRWAALGLLAVAVCVATFLLVDWMAIEYFDKFRDDIRTWVTDPLTGATKPIWAAQFADVAAPRRFWFTNLLWWGLGPALEIWTLAGVAWLLTRWRGAAWVAAAVPIGYFLTAGNTIAPFVRYAVPLAPALAVAGGVLSGDLLRRPRWRLPVAVATGLVIAASTLYAAAYMNVFRQPDSRVAAARYLRRVVPPGANVLVEPTQNLPPMGSYYDRTNFYRDYVPWGTPNADAERDDDYHLITLDSYVYLYDKDRRVSDEAKRAYIDRRLAKADWFVTDDTFLQFYQHLPEARYGVVKQFYRDLFGGRLGFALDRTFKVYPSLFGHPINDDRAELTFRLFDHPRVFVFRRTTPRPR
jgi:hypothetical protein